MPSKSKPAPQTEVRVQYFETGHDLNQRIEDWAREKGVRVLGIVPVYLEDVGHE